MKKKKNYLNVEQLTEVIKVIAYGAASSHYCTNICEYRNDIRKCMYHTYDGICTMGDDVLCEEYAKYIIDLYNNDFHLV